ncbi:unnamed protein product [Rangifer tarandus platyrhynchus]|uniref:Uncharacterized protein n=1 Tax=Rangifer tarandus platyrhynchus TaxID=3082113 RepID=A0ABN8YNC8_RANTA|nr:unnamed protein product [Rangifer tarandus platyrhynchus]
MGEEESCAAFSANAAVSKETGKSPDAAIRFLREIRFRCLPPGSSEVMKTQARDKNGTRNFEQPARSSAGRHAGSIPCGTAPSAGRLRSQGATRKSTRVDSPTSVPGGFLRLGSSECAKKAREREMVLERKSRVRESFQRLI